MDFIFFSEGALCFWKFLPIRKEDSLKFYKDSIEYEIYLKLDYEETFTHKPELKEIDKGNHWIKALCVNISFHVDDKIKQAIDRQEPPDELISKIASFYRILEDSFRDICRNDLGQYWLSHPHHNPEEKDRNILGGLHFRTNNSMMGKQFLFGAVIWGNSLIPNPSILIDEKRWEILGKLIDANYRTDLALVCLSNAKSLYKDENSRLALIEAVIALERTIFKFLESYLEDKDKIYAQKYLNSNSLHEATENLLPLVSLQLGIDEETISYCCEAINKRNEIIHRTCFRLDEPTIKKYINSIEYVVRKIVPHKF